MAARRPATLLLLLLIAGCSFGEEANRERRRNDCAGEELNLEVVGSLNATGHPIVQARLEQARSSAPRRLHVRLRDEPCAPDGAVRRVMHAVVYGPRSGEALPTPQRLQQQADPRLNELDTPSLSVATSSSTLHVTASDGYSSSETGTSTSARDQVNAPLSYSGYTKVSSIGRYKVHAQRANWTAAALVCEREGATLAVPSSQSEADALWRLKQSAPAAAQAQARSFLGLAVAGLERSTYYVGVRRLPGASNFTTIFGDEVSETGFSTWASEPSNEEHCGAMFSNAGLRAVPCESELSFVCELPL